MRLKSLTASFALAAAAATAYGAVVNSEGFEAYTSGTTLTNGWTATSTSTDWEHAYFYYDGTDNASIVTNYAEGEATAAKYPDAFTGVGSKYLQLSTEGGTLYRGVNHVVSSETASSKAALGAAYPLTSDLYVDTLVQFTPCEDAPTVGTENKLAIWLNVATNAQGEVSGTNLCVRAAYCDQDGSDEGAFSYSAKTYTVSGTTVNAGTWYRLTVRALPDLGGHPAFRIYINDNLVTADEAVASENALTKLSGDAKDMYDAKSAFPSMLNDADLTAVGFQGTGAVDDLAITEDAPGFMAITFTLNWDAAVTDLKVTVGDTEKEDFTLADKTASVSAPDGTTLAINYADVKYGNGMMANWTWSGVDATPIVSGEANEITNGWNFTVHSGSVINLGAQQDPEKNPFHVGDKMYYSLDAALADLPEAGGTIKLGREATLTSAAEIAAGKSVIFDLAGNTLTGAADAAVFANAGTLVVTNSVADGALVAGADGKIATNTGSLTLAVTDGTVTGTIADDATTGIAVTAGAYSTDPKAFVDKMAFRVEHGDMYSLVPVYTFTLTWTDDWSGFKFFYDAASEKGLMSVDGTDVTECTSGVICCVDKDDPVVYLDTVEYGEPENATYNVDGTTITKEAYGDENIGGVKFTVSASGGTIALGTGSTATYDVTVEAPADATIAYSTDEQATWTTLEDTTKITGLAKDAVVYVKATMADGATKTATYTVTEGETQQVSLGTATDASWYFAEGSGTEETPYLVDGVAGLQKLQQMVEAELTGEGKFFQQKDDIDMASAGAWAGIGAKQSTTKCFSGTYDGAGFAIKNVTFARNKYMGFFFSVKDATIKDLTINVAGVAEGTSEAGFAAFAGQTSGTTTFSGCKATGSIAWSDGAYVNHTAAGFVVKAVGTTSFTDCTNEVTVLSKSDNTKVGGFVGLLQSGTTLNLTRCINKGNITGDKDSDDASYVNGVGGLVGYSDGVVNVADCENAGVITAAAQCKNKDGAELGYYAGQIIGYLGAGKTFNVSGENTAAASQVAVGSGNLVDGLNFATVADGVATFVADSAAVAGANLKVMCAGATVTLANVNDAITLDETLATATVTTSVSTDDAYLAKNGNTYTVTARIDASEADITLAFDNVNTNEFPAITVAYNGTDLVADTDYTCEGWDPATIDATQAGVYTNKITFVGAYKGSAEAIFTVAAPAPVGPVTPSEEGTITKPEGSENYQFTPADTSVTSASVENLPEGAKVEVPAQITTVTGVPEGQLIVKSSNGYDITAALSITVTDGTTTVGDVLQEKADDVIDAVAEQLSTIAAASADTEVTVTLVPGLKYTVTSGSALTGMTAADPVQANSETKTLTLPKYTGSGFYKITVSK